MPSEAEPGDDRSWNSPVGLCLSKFWRTGKTGVTMLFSTRGLWVKALLESMSVKKML